MALSLKNISLVFMTLLCLVFMTLLCFFVLLLPSGCITGHGTSFGDDIASSGVHNRRELIRVAEKKEEVVTEKNEQMGLDVEKKMGLGVDWELRKAPSGPDPIHHNAAHPNNPTTTNSPPTRYQQLRP